MPGAGRLLALAALLLASVASACGTDAGRGAGAVERCVDRLVEVASTLSATDEELRRYVRETYCGRFARRGWVHPDGALRIEAHHWLEDAAECATARDGERPRTVPCDELMDAGRRELECGLLRHVRRTEVQPYLEELLSRGEVECDDGTPLDELGVP